MDFFSPRRSFCAPTLLLAAFVALGAVGGCGEPVDGPPRHVFLITVDTLRADHLAAWGYERETGPAADRLAADGVLFERAIAQWPKTGPSFASMFTGRYPQSTGITHAAAVRIPESYLTLPEFFGQRGYTPLAVVSNGVLGKRLGWDAGFEEYLQTWDLAPEVPDDPVRYRRWIEAGLVNRMADAMLERHADAEHLFVWLHYSDPHAPYILPEGVDNPFVDDAHYSGDEKAKIRNGRAVRIGDHTDLKHYVAAYDANVLYAERRIVEILDRARELDLLDDALVVYTSDHGESLGEHDYYFGHGRLPYQPGARVPLIISDPRRFEEGARIDRPVELVDLYPTLVDIVAPDARIQELGELAGESLVPLLRGAGRTKTEKPSLAYLEAGGGSPTTHYRSVQDERWKLVYHPPHPNGPGVRGWPPRYELYDLIDDPGENHDVAAEEREQLRRLRGELVSWMERGGGGDWIRRSPQRAADDAAGAVDPETEKALKALGYAD